MTSSFIVAAYTKYLCLSVKLHLRNPHEIQKKRQKNKTKSILWALVLDLGYHVKIALKVSRIQYNLQRINTTSEFFFFFFLRWLVYTQSYKYQRQTQTLTNGLDKRKNEIIYCVRKRQTKNT